MKIDQIGLSMRNIVDFIDKNENGVELYILRVTVAGTEIIPARTMRVDDLIDLCNGSKNAGLIKIKF